MATTEKVAEFEPQTFWLANPQLQLQIKVPGTRRYLKFSNGKCIAQTQQEADLIKATGMAYEDDGFVPTEEERNTITGYNPRSLRAFLAHQKHIPQG